MKLQWYSYDTEELLTLPDKTCIWEHRIIEVLPSQEAIKSNIKKKKEGENTKSRKHFSVSACEVLCDGDVCFVVLADATVMNNHILCYSEVILPCLWWGVCFNHILALASRCRALCISARSHICTRWTSSSTSILLEQSAVALVLVETALAPELWWARHCIQLTLCWDWDSSPHGWHLPVATVSFGLAPVLSHSVILWGTGIYRFLPDVSVSSQR